MPDTVRYAIGDLADLAGVSRRTVRYYVHEGLLPSPFGLGRGNHYGQEHLDGLLRVKAMQEAGLSLDEIRRALGHQPSAAAPVADAARSAGLAGPPVERELWRRIVLAPGVELHVAGHIRLPSSAKLNDLAQWCRAHLASSREEDPHA